MNKRYLWCLIGALLLAFTLFGQEAAEVRQIDRPIAAELQLIQVQIENLQLKAQLILNDYMEKQGLKRSEWELDLQRMTLTKKATK